MESWVVPSFIIANSFFPACSCSKAHQTSVATLVCQDDWFQRLRFKFTTMIGKDQNNVASMNILWLVALYLIRLPHTHTYIGYVTCICIYFCFYTYPCAALYWLTLITCTRCILVASPSPKKGVLYQRQPGYNTPGGYRLPVTSKYGRGVAEWNEWSYSDLGDAGSPPKNAANYKGKYLQWLWHWWVLSY